MRLCTEFLYLAVLMDIFTRAIRGWHLSCRVTEELVRTALERALKAYLAPCIRQSDQGVQDVAHGYAALLETHGMQISMAAIGHLMEKVFAERLIDTLKEEECTLTTAKTTRMRITAMATFGMIST